MLQTYTIWINKKFWIRVCNGNFAYQFSSQFCPFIPNKSVFVLFYLLSILVLLQHACNVHYFKMGPISFWKGITLFLPRYIFNFHSFTLQFYDHTGIRPKNKLHNLFVVMFEPPSLFAESTKSVHIYFSVHVQYGNTGCEVFKRGVQN